MNILAVLIWGTLVDVHTAPLELQTHFHSCNMYKGTVVDVREAKEEDNSVTYVYTVEHKCKGGLTAVRRDYEPAKIRPSK
jgi:hypothetical protein